MTLATLLAPVLGASAGYGFHRLVGCRSGACAIWASPYISTLYGAVLGLMIARG